MVGNHTGFGEVQKQLGSTGSYVLMALGLISFTG